MSLRKRESKSFEAHIRHAENNKGTQGKRHSHECRFCVRGIIVCGGRCLGRCALARIGSRCGADCRSRVRRWTAYARFNCSFFRPISKKGILSPRAECYAEYRRRRERGRGDAEAGSATDGHAIRGAERKGIPVKGRSESEAYLVRCLVKMYIEDCRFIRTVERMSEYLTGTEQRRLKSRWEWLRLQWRQLFDDDALRLEVRWPAGDTYDEGLPVEVLNADECQVEGRYVIADVIEPMITDGEGAVVHFGKVFLRRVDHE